MIRDKRAVSFQTFARERQYKLFTYDVETAQKELGALLDARLAEALSFKIASAKGSLEWEKMRLAELIPERLEVPYPIHELGGYVVEWADAVVQSISDIAVGGDSSTGPVDFQKLSFVVHAQVGALLRRLHNYGRGNAGLPALLPVVPITAIDQITISPEYRSLALEVEVEAKGNIVASEYCGFEFVAIRLKRAIA